MNNLDVYHGFNRLPVPGFLFGFWRRFCCKRGWHLFDEVLSSTGGWPDADGWRHYLICDVCGVEVDISDA